MKTNIGLVEYCKDQLGTPYWWGGYGQVADEKLLKKFKKMYPLRYLTGDFESQFGQKIHDCSGLIKGYMWSETSDSIPEYNPSHNINAEDMIKKCSVSGLIDSLPEIPGLLLFKEGHVGVYIGNGEAIEARGRNFGIVKTKIKDRDWIMWGKLDWINYIVS